MSGNIIIGYPNHADAKTFSAGSWLAGLPVTNLANRELWKVARSSDAATASTKFRVDLGAAKTQRAFALCNHNLSADAVWRVLLGTTAGASDVWSSAWTQAWTMDFDPAPWESSVWWGTIGGDEYLRSPFAAMLVAPDWYSARYITVEINDTANVDGYVQLGRFFSGTALQPTYNANYGLQDSLRDLSTIDSAESGAIWATERRTLRGVSLVLGHLSPGEAAYFHEMQRQTGIAKEVLYIPYPDDMSESQRYGFLGRFIALDPLDYRYFRGRGLPLKIEELG